MDEAARQTSFSSSSSTTSSSSSDALQRPSSGSASSRQHRRTGSVGAVSEHEVPSQRSSVNSACASASSMDSLDIDKVPAGREVVGQSSLSTQGQNQTSTEVWLKIFTTTHTLRLHKSMTALWDCYWESEAFVCISVWLMHVSIYSMFGEICLYRHLNCMNHQYTNGYPLCIGWCVNVVWNLLW